MPIGLTHRPARLEVEWDLSYAVVDVPLCSSLSFGSLLIAVALCGHHIKARTLVLSLVSVCTRRSTADCIICYDKAVFNYHNSDDALLNKLDAKPYDN